MDEIGTSRKGHSNNGYSGNGFGYGIELLKETDLDWLENITIGG